MLACVLKKGHETLRALVQILICMEKRVKSGKGKGTGKGEEVGDGPKAKHQDVWSTPGIS